MEKIMEILHEEILAKDNKKIVKGEKLESFLQSFTKDELIRLAIVRFFIDMDLNDEKEIIQLSNESKKKIIQYIIDNLEKIINFFAKVIDNKTKEELKIIIFNITQEKLNITDIDVSLFTLMLLKNYALAKIEYNGDSESTMAYIPVEIIDKFLLAFEDEEVQKETKRNEEICNYVTSLLDFYGIISIEELYELFTDQMYEIEVSEFYQILLCKSVIYESFNIYTPNNYEDILICNLCFQEEDEAITFFRKQKGKYKKFSLEDLKAGKLLDKIPAYKKLIHYLISNYIGIEDDIENIRESVVEDYLTTAQYDENLAKTYLDNTLQMYFEKSEKEYQQIYSYLKYIFKAYPKWIKKGNI